MRSGATRRARRWLEAAAGLLLALAPLAARADGGDTCAAPTSILALPFVDTGTTVGAGDDGFGAIAAGCSTYSTVPGPDVLYSLSVGPGNSLTFDVVPETGYDTSIYLLRTCDNGNSCVKGSDAALVSGEEAFSVSGLATGTYTFYVDSFYSAGSASEPQRHQGAYTLTVSGSLGAVPTTTSTTTSTSSSTSTSTSTSSSSTTTTSTTTTSQSTSTSSSTSTTSTTPPPSTTTTTATSTTTSTTPPSLCTGGTGMLGASIRITKAGEPIGNEELRLRGVLDFALPTVPATFDPAGHGAQLLVEDLGDGGAPLFELTTATAPVPPGEPGAGCSTKDGWRKTTYRNRSDALGPDCVPGSARGLVLLKLRDKRAHGRGIVLKALARKAALAEPVGPLRLTVVLGADAAAGLSGDCASVTFAPGACEAKGKSFVCK